MKAYLKALLFLALVFVLSLSLAAVAGAETGGILEDTRFPDMAFRRALDERYGDDDHNVNFLRTEINVSNSGISDLTGIELFTNLEELDCSGNNLEGLFLEPCEKLSVLDCRNNPLAVVNTAELRNLERLYCSGDRLTQLVLPSYRDKLKILNISNSQITTLDVHDFVALEGVTCFDSALTSLDVSGCTNLEAINASRSRLGTLNLDECAALEFIYVDGCNLTSLSIGNLEALKDLKCGNNPMTSLTVSVCPLLETIDCPDCQLETLSVVGCGNLYDLNCEHNRLTELDGIPSLAELYCEGNRISQLGPFPEIGALFCADNLLTSLTVPESLFSLDCSGNRLTKLDLSQCPDLFHANCANNALTTLNVSGAAQLGMLNAHGNQLAELDIGGTALEDVDWVAMVEYEGAVVMKWYDLTFDRDTILRRGEEVIYTPQAGDVPLPTFFLPYDLVTIESEAFSGIAAEAVLIPESVQTIVGDPFAGSGVEYIYGHPGTAAETFAAGRYTFVPIGESD